MPYSKRVCNSCGLDYRPERSSQTRCDNCIAAERWIATHAGFLHALPIGFAILILVAAFGPGAKGMYLASRDKQHHEPPQHHTQSIPIITTAQVTSTEDLLTAHGVPESIKAPVKPVEPAVKIDPTSAAPKVHIDTYKVENPKPKHHKPAHHEHHTAAHHEAPKPHSSSTKHLATAVSGFHHTVAHAASTTKVAAVLAYARAQIGESYVLGGAGPSVWDCSGLTLMAFRSVGVSIGTHSATNQYNTARSRGLLVPYSQKRPGDLIFYSDGGGDMYHVTIYSGNGMMIEAPNPTTHVRERSIWGTPYPYVARFL